MLVLSRRVNEKSVFPSIAVRIQLVAIKAGVARLGIEAPPNIPIYREELLDRTEGAQQTADTPTAVTDSAVQLYQLRRAVAQRVAQAQAELARLRLHWINQGATVHLTEMAGLEAELRRLAQLVGNEAA